MTLDRFIDDAREWLDANAPRRDGSAEAPDAEHDFSVSVFHSLSFEDERALLQRIQA